MTQSSYWPVITRMDSPDEFILRDRAFVVRQTIQKLKRWSVFAQFPGIRIQIVSSERIQISTYRTED